MDPVEFKKYISTSITVTTIELEQQSAPTPEIAGAAILTMVACGGFLATVITKSKLDFASKMGYKIDQNSKTGPVITILDDIAKRLKPEEVQAIALHEEGHVILGHLEGMNKDDGEVAINSIDFSYDDVLKNLNLIAENSKQQNELDADAYAAGVMGASVVRSAIIAVLKSQSREIVKLAAINGQTLKYRDVLKSSLNHPDIRDRLDALNVNKSKGEKVWEFIKSFIARKVTRKSTA